MEDKWMSIWRARWAQIKRGVELGLSGFLLVVGIMLSVALFSELPGLFRETLTGDSETARTLFVCTAGIAVCVLQWRWRAAIYPGIRRGTPQE